MRVRVRVRVKETVRQTDKQTDRDPEILGERHGGRTVEMLCGDNQLAVACVTKMESRAFC